MKIIFDEKTSTIEIDFEGAKIVSYNPAEGVVDIIKSNVNVIAKQAILSKRFLSAEQYEKHMKKFNTEGKKVLGKLTIKDKIITRKEAGILKTKS